MTTGPRVRTTRTATANLQAQGALGVADGDEAAMERALLLISQADQADPTARALRTEAVIPDMLIQGQARRRTIYDDETELVEDPVSFYNCMADREGPWTEKEDIEFRRLFALHPKQFGSIAKGLPGRSVGACVEHYYTTKKIRSYKELAVGARAGPRRLRGKEGALSRDLNQRKKGQKSGIANGQDNSRSEAGSSGRGRRPPLGDATPSEKSVSRRTKRAPEVTVESDKPVLSPTADATLVELKVPKPPRKGTKRKTQDLVGTPDGVDPSANGNSTTRKPEADATAPVKRRRKAAVGVDGQERTPVARGRKAGGSNRRPSTEILMAGSAPTMVSQNFRES
jgi:hypothetical protein